MGAVDSVRYLFIVNIFVFVDMSMRVHEGQWTINCDWVAAPISEFCQCPMHKFCLLSENYVMYYYQVNESSDCRNDTLETSDIDSDQAVANERCSHSRSHTVSDTELDCAVAKLGRRKVYRKRKGQTRTKPTTRAIQMKDFLSPTVSGSSILEIIEQGTGVKLEQTEVDVVVQPISATVKSEPSTGMVNAEPCNVVIKTAPEEQVTGKYQ